MSSPKLVSSPHTHPCALGPLLLCQGLAPPIRPFSPSPYLQSRHQYPVQDMEPQHVVISDTLSKAISANDILYMKFDRIWVEQVMIHHQALRKTVPPCHLSVAEDLKHYPGLRCPILNMVAIQIVGRNIKCLCGKEK